MKSKIIKRKLSDEKQYSEKDIVLYLENFLEKSLCGDCFTGSPWGEESNRRLYVAIFGIGENELRNRVTNDDN